MFVLIIYKSYKRSEIVFSSKEIKDRSYIYIELDDEEGNDDDGDDNNNDDDYEEALATKTSWITGGYR